MSDTDNYPLISLTVTRTGEVKHSSRSMTKEQCEMVLGKTNELREGLTTILLSVDAEREYREHESQQQHINNQTPQRYPQWQ